MQALQEIIQRETAKPRKQVLHHFSGGGLIYCSAWVGTSLLARSHPAELWVIPWSSPQPDKIHVHFPALLELCIQLPSFYKPNPELLMQNQHKKCTLFQVWVKINTEILGLCDEPSRHYLLIERLNPENVSCLKWNGSPWLCHASVNTYLERSPKPSTLIFSIYNFVKSLSPHLEAFP